MPVDEKLLEDHQSYVDPELRISERFVRIHVGGRWTVGVLARPLGAEHPTAWVVAHSFGPEQMELEMTEVFLARRLARAGFPVLRFHGQGYGDSEELLENPDFASHVRDTSDAVRVMQVLSGSSEVGLIGARFGGTVAAVVADRLALPKLILIAPAVNGKRFVTELLRGRRISEVAEDGSTSRIEGDVRWSLEASRDLNVKGFMLTHEMRREMEGIELLSLLHGFRGRVLILQVSMQNKPNRAITELVDHLRRFGAVATLRVVTDALAPRFGNEHMRFADADVLVDMLSDLNDSLLGAALDWLEGGLPPESGSPE